MDRITIEDAIRTLACDRALLARFKADPHVVGGQLGLSPSVAEAIVTGDRGALRALGLDSGITILAGRWFGESAADTARDTRFVVDESIAVPDPDVPSNLVFAGGCSHVPDFLARPEIDPPDQIARLRGAYEALAVSLKESSPDVLLVTADNHFQRFDTGGYVIGTGSNHTGSMAFFNRPDIGLTITGHPPLANSAAAAARAAGLEVETTERIELDHGLIVPLRMVLPRPDLAVIPILTQPARTYSPFSARAFGAALRDLIEESGKKVGILATGGLSHWLDPGKFGFVDEEFDRYLLGMLRAGRAHDVGDLEPYPLLDHGQYEFVNWLIMLGALGPGVRGEVLAYEPMTASGGGWTVVRMLLRQPAVVG